MTKVVSSAILLLLGVALVKLGISDDLLLYVRPSARPWVLVAGLALLVLAGSSLLSLLRGRDDDSAQRADEIHGATRTGWLVLAPVLAVLLIAPPALGAFTANRTAPRGVTGHAQVPRPGTAPAVLGMYQFYLLANRQPESLAGRTLTLTGFVAKHLTGGFVLARLVITCCAADAFSVTATVATTATSPPMNGWVHVTGRFAGLGTDKTPKIIASGLTPINQPSEPYDVP